MNEYSAKVSFFALFCAFLAVLAPQHAFAQTDAVTRLAEKNPFILVRLAALSLETPEEQGEALAGLVEAELARGLLKEAQKELSRITDKNWRARALTKLADYQYDKGRDEVARNDLREAAQSVDTSVKPNDANIALREIALKQAKLGAFGHARDSILQMTDVVLRVRTLLDVADLQSDQDGKVGAEKTLALASQEAQKIKTDDEKTAFLILNVAEKQSGIGDAKEAAKTIAYADEKIINATFNGKDNALSELAAIKSASGDHKRAMILVRSILDEPLQIRSTATVARAVAQRGDIESAVPLFTLALDNAKEIKDTNLQYELLTHIVRQQAMVGRLADAFSNAGLIRDRKKQASALFGMAEELIAQNKLDEALKLTNYIPYIGLRGRIFAAKAQELGDAGDAIGASAMLARAMEPAGQAAVPEFLEPTLDIIIDTQIRVGDENTSDALFERMRELIQAIPEDIERVRLFTQLARAQGLRDQKEEAQKTISSAWRMAYLHRHETAFPKTVVAIVKAMVSIGQVLEAFDTAARIPWVNDPELSDSQQPRNLALRIVAVGAAKDGEIRMAIRAARKIREPSARAATLAAVAVSTATRYQ